MSRGPSRKTAATESASAPASASASPPLHAFIAPLRAPPLQFRPPAEAPPFDEALYLRLNPDVAKAVAAGTFRSGAEHYQHFGRAEGRPATAPASLVRDRVVITADPGTLAERPRPAAGNIDHIKISPAGGIYVVGWVNDSQDRLDSVDLYFSSWSVSFSAANIARVRRPDAEASVGLAVPHACGFWGFLYAARRLPANLCSAVVRLKSGAELQAMVTADIVEDDELRMIALSGLALAKYLGNPYFAAVQSIDAAIAAQLIDFNQMLTRRAVNAPYVERFGCETGCYKGSVVVCLFGKIEYMAVQQAMFARQPGIGDYEFIYVCNSPESAESLLREARLCALIYGLDVTVILLNANAGFAAANNLAARHARSGRLMFLNPDVFPRDGDWAGKHSTIVAQLPAAQTALFGAPLYYDDGALMHGGMYFELDKAPGFSRGGRQDTAILRVEHYGKGAAPDTPEFLCARIVPAVTGAFISVARGWFETLEGFSEAYIFGHYEDADLCLKSLEAGRPAWLHDAKLWHLEGKGSSRQPQHEGGAAVNRWLFTNTWLDTVRDGLTGASPRHPALNITDKK
jgi:GT2 family glycosyltransferase